VQHPRQLGDVGGDAPGLVAGEQLGGRGVLEKQTGTVYPDLFVSLQHFD
jgi:hypothetical protein